MKTKTKIRPKSKENKLLLHLLDGERHRHRVALVTEEGEWNQHEPNSGMARMFVVMLLVHVVLIGGIIIYDFMGDEGTPQQSATQAARAMSASGLPQTSPAVINAQAQAAADTEQYDNYEMRSGDSLKSIAAKFGSTEEEITRLNMIDKGLQIGPGTMLRVPKQAVPSAIPVDPKTLKPMVATTADGTPKAVRVQDQPPATKVPSEAVKPVEAPASLSAAAITPMSLVAPNESPPETASLSAAANMPATASPAPETVAALPPPTKPKATSLLQAEAESAAAPVKTQEKEPARPAVVAKVEPKPEPKPLARPTPVPPPSQMLKKIANSPPAKKTADTPPKPAAKPVASRTHTLQPGETLYRLSAKYGVPIATIQKANNIKNPNAMRDGMKLVIPAK